MRALIIIAIALLATTAGAETLHNGRVYKTTADHIIARERMTCKPGATRVEHLADGRLAIITSKVCEKGSR